MGGYKQKGAYDPGRDTGLMSPTAYSAQKSAERQIAAAVAHLPKNISSQYVASAKMSDTPATLGSIPDGKFDAPSFKLKGAGRG